MAQTVLLIPKLFAFASLGCSVLNVISMKNVRNVKNINPVNLVNMSPKKDHLHLMSSVHRARLERFQTTVMLSGVNHTHNVKAGQF